MYRLKRHLACTAVRSLRWVEVRRCPWNLARRAIHPLAVRAEQHQLRRCVFQSVHGIWLGTDVATPQAGVEYLRRVAGAFDLIRAIAPKTYARVRGSLPTIVVLPAPEATLSTFSGVCFLDEARVTKYSSAVVAASLIHEATHARLERRGIRNWPDLKNRIEAVCVREELAFAARLPRRDYPNLDAFLGYLRQRLQGLSVPSSA